MRKITLLTTLFVFIFSLTFGQKVVKEIEKGSQLQTSLKTDNLYGSKIPGDYKQKAPLSEDFENDFPPFGWWLISGTGDWDKSNQTEDHTSGSGYFARYDCFNINGSDAASLVLPTLAPTSGDNTLSFWVNYYLIDGDYGQSAELYVDISTDFGDTWSNGSTNIIDGQHGAGWFEHTVDLSSYNGSNVTVRLRAISDYGSYNIAVDDVTGPEKYVASDDAGISSINEPEGLLLNSSYDIKETLVNYGSSDLTSVDISTVIRDTISQSEVNSYNYNWTGTLASTQNTDVTVANHNFSNFGVYNIISSTSNPNGNNDPIFTNDQSSQLVKVIEPGMVYQDYEDGEFPSDWTVEEDWNVLAIDLMNGSHTAAISQQDGDPARKLITPQLSVQSGDKFIFLLGGNLNDAGASNNLGYSTLEVKYASSPDGPWTSIKTFDMGDEGDAPHYVSVDLNSLAGDDYYFAFETVSDFYYSQNPSYETYVFIDDLMGPVKTSTSANDVKLVDVIYQHDFIYEGDNAGLKAIVKNVGLNEQTGNTVTFSVDGSQVGDASIGSIKYLEKDTVSVNWTASSQGKHTITASLESDDNTGNNDATTEGIVVGPGQMAQGFEDTTSAELQEWKYDEGWYQSGSTGATFGAYEGDSLFVCAGEATGATYSDIKLISPKLENDQHYNKVYFYAKAVNTSDTTETTIQLQYTQDTSSGNWTSITAPIELTGQWELYEADLGSVPYGEVFFAFSASTNWQLDGYVSYVMLDHVVGVSYLRPGKQGTIPYEGSDKVALDSNAYFQFDEEVTVVDLSGVSISSNQEASVSNVSAALQSDNKTVEITHDPYSYNNEEYTVTIPYNSVKNDKNAGNLKQEWSFTTIMAAPEAEYYYPEEGASGIALDEDVLVRLNQEVTVNDLSGVTISGATEGTVTGVSASLASDSKTINIDHDAFANMGEEYTVTIPAGAVSNEDDVNNNEVSWSFTTRSSGQPVADTLLPNNNGESVALDSVVYLVFDMAVSEGDLTGVDIINSDSVSVSNVSATLLNANSADNDTLMINHDNFADYGEYYSVIVPAGAVNASGTDNAKITWQFKTLLPPPEIITKDPVAGATGVSISKTVKVEFDQEVNENDFSGIELTGATSGSVSGVNSTLVGGSWIYIQHDDFVKGEEYTVTIPEAAVINDDGITNEGPVQWSFTTEYPKPQPEQLTPADGATEQPISGLVSAKFNVSVDSLNFSAITLEDSTGSTVTINPYFDEAENAIEISYDGLKYGMKYTVSIPESAVENQDGITNDAFSWSFTTLGKYKVTFSVSYGNKAIEDAEVAFVNDTLTTNSDGKATIKYTNGTYDYEISKYGYKDVSGSITVDGADLTEEISLTGAFNLTFKIQDEKSNPLDAATIYINTDEDTLSTDGQGVAVLSDIPDGTYSYKVEKQNYFTENGAIGVANDTTVTIKLNSSSPSGIGDFADEDIKIYPNPSNGEFAVAVKSPEDCRISIYSISGSLIFTRNIESTKTFIDLRDKEDGIYILEITEGNKTFQSKIIKQ